MKEEYREENTTSSPNRGVTVSLRLCAQAA